ncbi:hypothetical protein PGB90_001580 [Kerria lacca]
MDDDGEPFVLSSGVATATRPPAYKKLAAHRYNANFTDHHLHFLEKFFFYFIRKNRNITKKNEPMCR